MFFLTGGVMALLIRAQLASPHSSLLTFSQYNALFTMHGSLMLYLFAGPFAFGGLANYILPLQVGAPDMAFPRLNALSYWLYLSGSITHASWASWSPAAPPRSGGWPTPRCRACQLARAGPDLWILGIDPHRLLGHLHRRQPGARPSSTCAPGHDHVPLPIFTWNMLVTAILILIAFPILTAAMVMLFADRHFGTHIYTPRAAGSPLLYQNLFWFFGHPEVYILALPYFGIVTEIIPVFSKKPLFGYKGMVFATMAIAALSTGVWAHHMFTTGAVLLPFFSLLDLLIAVPTGIKFFNWIGTMWRGQLTFTTPMLFCIGFLFAFLMGGLTGIMLASPPIDFATHDTYFVVAHFHQVLFGTAVLRRRSPASTTGTRSSPAGCTASGWARGTSGCSPSASGWRSSPSTQLGLWGMPRRVAVVPGRPGVAGLERGVDHRRLRHRHLLRLPARQPLGVVAQPRPRRGQPLGRPHPGMVRRSPPAHHNFHGFRPIRSERPVWDCHHPDAPAIGAHGAPRRDPVVVAAGE